MKKNWMNLQLFAQPANDAQQANQDTDGASTTDQSNQQNTDPNAAQADQSNGQQNDQQNQQSSQQQTPRTFSEADVNRIVAERLSRERRNMQQQIQQQIETARQEGRTEAERLAQMSAEERARHEQEQAEQAAQQREQQLAQRERDITRRELRAQAIDTMSNRGLPTGLADLLDFSSADACNASITTVEQIFRDAVQQGVNERLRASGVNLPAPGNQPDYEHMSDADYYAATLQKK